MQHAIFAISYYPKMNKKLYNSLKQGLQEAIAMSRGELAAGRIWQVPTSKPKTTPQPTPTNQPKKS